MSAQSRMGPSIVEVGSSNVYRDLGYVEAEGMQRKAALASVIAQRILEQNLTLETASRIVHLDPQTLSQICQGRFRTFNEADLLEIQARLG
jgi:predicted XRE-type DNA-binding protein